MQNKKEDLVSIIIPVYNTGRKVDKCINSIVHQTYKKIEIIIIDDGSNEETYKIIDQWNFLDDRIKVVHQKNSGVSGARNRGIKEAKGKWIMFVDADDYISLDYVQLMIENANDYTISICEYIEENHDGEKTEKTFDLQLRNMKLREVFPVLYDKGFINTLWNKIFYSKIIKENKIEFSDKLDLGEDLLFVLEYLRYIEDVVIIKKPLYHYIRYEFGSLRTKKYDNYDLLMMYLNEQVKKYTDLYCDQQFNNIYPVYHRLLSSTMNAYMEIFEINNQINIFMRSKKIRKKMKQNKILEDVLIYLRKYKGISFFQYMMIKRRYFLLYYYSKRIYLKIYRKSNSR